MNDPKVDVSEEAQKVPVHEKRLTSEGVTWMTPMRGSPGSPVRTPSFKSPNHCGEVPEGTA